MPKHGTVARSNAWVSRTPRSRVAHWPRNASGRTVMSLVGTDVALLMNLISSFKNTSITSVTMIARSNRAVLHWQPFGASDLPGVPVLIWRQLISVTGAEINMCDVPSTLPWRSCPSSVGGTWSVRCMLVVGACCVRGWRRYTLALPGSKVGKLKNAGGSIVVSDPTAKAQLALLCRGCLPQHGVFRLSFRGLSSAFVTAAAALGFRSSDLLSYSFRRGEAAFHFACYGSVELPALPFEGRRLARPCAALVSQLSLGLPQQFPEN